MTVKCKYVLKVIIIGIICEYEKNIRVFFKVLYNYTSDNGTYTNSIYN